MQAISTGLVEATLQDAEGNEIDVAFKDALSVNGIGAPLISVSSLAEQGALIAFNAEGGTITVGDDCRLSFGQDHKIKCIIRKPVPQVKTTAHEAFNTAQLPRDCRRSSTALASTTPDAGSLTIRSR